MGDYNNYYFHSRGTLALSKTALCIKEIHAIKRLLCVREGRGQYFNWGMCIRDQTWSRQSRVNASGREWVPFSWQLISWVASFYSIFLLIVRVGLLILYIDPLPYICTSQILMEYNCMRSPKPLGRYIISSPRDQSCIRTINRVCFLKTDVFCIKYRQASANKNCQWDGEESQNANYMLIMPRIGLQRYRRL